MAYFPVKKCLRTGPKKWTIQINFTARDEYGKPFRARSCFQCEAPDIPSAYKLAEEADLGAWAPVKFGAIIPGWHVF